MNKQIESLLQKLLATSGPLAALLSNKLGWDASTVGMVLELALAILTPLAAAAWGWLSSRDSALVAAVADMSPAKQQAALENTTDTAKVKIAEALPAVATIVIKDEANGALAAAASSPAHPHIVTETQNEVDAKLGTKVQP